MLKVSAIATIVIAAISSASLKQHLHVVFSNEYGTRQQMNRQIGGIIAFFFSFV